MIFLSLYILLLNIITQLVPNRNGEEGFYILDHSKNLNENRTSAPNINRNFPFTYASKFQKESYEKGKYRSVIQ